MTLHRSDYDQAVCYLKYAYKLLQRKGVRQNGSPREVLQLTARRLSPGDACVGDAAAEITVLRR